SRPGEGNAGSPYRSPYPNGAAEQPAAVGTSPGTPSRGSEVGAEQDESASKKIGRFFRRAMDRLSNRDDGRRQDDERGRRDREMEERYRRRDSSWQSDRSRGQAGLGAEGQAPSWRGPVRQRGAAPEPWRAEGRGEQTLGQQALGHSPSDTD